MATNEYDVLIKKLDEECKEGITASCDKPDSAHVPSARPNINEYSDANYGESDLAQLPSIADNYNNAELWGVLFMVWVVIAIPKLVRETVVEFFKSRSESPAQKTAREDRYTKFGLWWSVGLVFLLTTWKLKMPLTLAALLLSAYALGSFVYIFRTTSSRWVDSLNIRRLRNPAKNTRILISIALIWILAVQTWGFIFDWDNHFDLTQYIALHVLPLFGVFVVYKCVRWINNSNNK